MTPFLRTPYNYDMNKAGDESGLTCKDQSRTKQSFAEEADINTIVRRFHLTGQLPTDVRMPQYADFTEIVTFQDAMNAIRAAEESFMAMPAEIRTRFHNDPAEFVQFCGDEKNKDEAVKLGLVPKPLPAEQPAPLTNTGATPTLPPAAPAATTTETPK